MIKMWGRNTSSNVQKVMWAIGEMKLPHQRIDVGGAFGGAAGQREGAEDEGGNQVMEAHGDRSSRTGWRGANNAPDRPAGQGAGRSAAAADDGEGGQGCGGHDDRGADLAPGEPYHRFCSVT